MRQTNQAFDAGVSVDSVKFKLYLFAHLMLLLLVGFGSSLAQAETMDFDSLVGNNFANGTYGSGSLQYTWSDSGDTPTGRLNSFNTATQGSDDGIRLSGQGSFTIDFVNTPTDLRLVFPEFEEGPLNGSSLWEWIQIDVYNASGTKLNTDLFEDHVGSNVNDAGANRYQGDSNDSGSSDQDLYGTLMLDFGTQLIDRVEVQFDTQSASLRMVEAVAADTLPEDYGDAPTSGTAPIGSGTNNYGSARHRITSGIYLGGALPDADSANQPHSNAAGDDADGTDDEDGISLPTFTQGQTATISATVAGAGGYLQAWIDFDGNGTFDAGEQVATNLQDGDALDTDAATGTIAFNVSVPASATTNQTFARFRWSTTQNLDSTTVASDGEVEDYAITINAPLATGPGTLIKSTDPDGQYRNDIAWLDWSGSSIDDNGFGGMQNSNVETFDL